MPSHATHLLLQQRTIAHLSITCRHPVSLATQAITDAGAEQPALSDALQQLSEQLDAAEAATAKAGTPAAGKEGSPLQELAAVAIKSSTLAAVLNSLRKQHEAHVAAADLKVCNNGCSPANEQLSTERGHSAPAF